MRWFPARLRRRRFTLGTLAVVAALAAAAVPVLAELDNTGFHAEDGNLTLEAGQTYDWVNAPNLAWAFDRSNSSSDNAYANGAKQDAECASLGEGSIPPNKDDLIRLFVANDKGDDTDNDTNSDPDDYLYLGFERYLARDGSTASAHIAFEFNQVNLADPGENDVGLCDAQKNTVDPKRTAGDLLVLYDFAGGNSIPDLATMKWLTAASQGTCEVKKAPPCWGNRTDLDGTDSEGKVNTVQIQDPVDDDDDPLTPASPWPTLEPNQFGEAALNLQAAGFFQNSTVCDFFGSARMMSRSSGNSFQATLKDTTSPLPVDITNCGSVKVRKTDDAGAPMAGVTFTLFNDDGEDTEGDFVPDDPDDPDDNGDTATTFTCDTVLDEGDEGTEDDVAECTMTQVPFGTYWLVEEDLDGYTEPAPQLFSIPDNSGDTSIEFNIVNQRENASLTFFKQDDAGNAMPGVTFTLWNDDGEDSPDVFDDVDDPDDPDDDVDTATGFTCTTEAEDDDPDPNTAGRCVISGINSFGTFWLVETPVSGYETQDPIAVTLAPGDELTLPGSPLVNPRQFKVIVLVCREHDDTLYRSSVSIDGDDVSDSLDADDIPGDAAYDEGDLCAIEPGSKSGLTADDDTDYDADVGIGTSPIPDPTPDPGP